MMATMYATIGDRIWIGAIQYEIGEDNGQPILIRPPIVCMACQDNECGDYLVKNDAMAIALCPACVSRALSFKTVMNALNHVADVDDELREALAYINEMDTYMKSLHMPYVSSDEMGWDDIRAQSYGEQQESIDKWRDVILNVIRTGSI